MLSGPIGSHRYLLKYIMNVLGVKSILGYGTGLGPVMTWFEYGPGLTFQIYVPSAWCWWVWDMNVSAYAWFKALWIFGHVCLAFSLVILCFGWRGLVFSVRLL